MLTPDERRQIEERLTTASRALRAADRLQRVARQELAQLIDLVDELTTPECAAEGGTAHEQDHEPLLARP